MNIFHELGKMVQGIKYMFRDTFRGTVNLSSHL